MQVIHDINCLGKEISGAYLDHVLRVLSSCSTEVLDLVKLSILHCGKSLDDLLPLVINTIKEALVQKSVEVSITMLSILLICISVVKVCALELSYQTTKARHILLGEVHVWCA